MKNKILSFILAFALVLTYTVCLSACSGDVVTIPSRVSESLPNKVWVEYGNVVLAKDGNDYYVESAVYSMSSRGEVYIKENLTNPVGSGDEAQNYISARWDGGWIYAYDDGILDTYHANSDNHSAMMGFVNSKSGPCSSEWMFRGYSAVNDTTIISVVQKPNQTITVGENEVECEVWECTFDYFGTYSKTKYWFAADSHVYLKSLSIEDRNQDIDTDGTVDTTHQATFYQVGVPMSDVLASKGGKTMPVFPEQYR